MRLMIQPAFIENVTRAAAGKVALRYASHTLIAAGVLQPCRHAERTPSKSDSPHESAAQRWVS